MIGELWLGTILIAILTETALVRQSIRFVIAALSVDFFVALLYVPWMAFFASSSDDTDWQSILAAWRTAATGWVAVSTATLAILLWLVGWNFIRRGDLSAEPNLTDGRDGSATTAPQPANR
jgi:hypothetical protein